MGGEADGEVELRKAVRSRVKAGVDCIKIMASGGNMTRRTNTFAPQYSVEELRAVVEECQRLRIPLTAHAHGTEGIRAAVEAGVPMIEHCSFSRPGGIDLDELLIARMADQGIVVSPTVSVGYLNWPDDGLRQRRAEVLRAMLGRGIQFVMSTDCGIPGVPHNALAGGMCVLCDFGALTPLETLRLATSTSAVTLGLKDRGTLEAGKLADAVVVEGEPTQDLRALDRIRYVFKSGTLVYQSDSPRGPADSSPGLRASASLR
jgi:imidazolonepropionase-like amidohydrolase